MRNIQKRLELIFADQVTSLKMIHIENETLVKVKFPFTK